MEVAVKRWLVSIQRARKNGKKFISFFRGVPHCQKNDLVPTCTKTDTKMSNDWCDVSSVTYSEGDFGQYFSRSKLKPNPRPNIPKPLRKFQKFRNSYQIWHVRFKKALKFYYGTLDWSFLTFFTLIFFFWHFNTLPESFKLFLTYLHVTVSEFIPGKSSDHHETKFFIFVIQSNPS